MKSHKNTILLISSAVIIVIAIAAIWYFSAPQAENEISQLAAGAEPTAPTSTVAAPLDTFAVCLGQKGFVMYGLYSCPHCQAEKALFGSSFQYVKYVECSTNPDECTAENVDAVPTWIESDGSRLIGTQTLAQLAQASGCALPAGY